MTPPKRHPSLEEWLAWIDSGREKSSELGRHWEACEVCRGRVAALDELSRASRAREWALPPETVRRRALTRPGDPAPDRGRRVRKASWAPADVRGSAVGAAGEPRTISHAIPGVRVGLVAIPRPGDKRWEIRGKAWLTGAESVRFLLVHDDHVLAETVLRESGEFVLDEPAPRGWSLEVHPARGSALVIHDPESDGP